MTAANFSVFMITILIKLRKEKFLLLRSFMYGGVGIFEILPGIHLLYNEFFNKIHDNFSISSSLIYYFLLGACYLTGLFIQTVRLPEKYHPGRYDIYGNSH